MKRTIAIITLIGLPALLIALAGVRLVMHDRSGICSAVANQPECTCGCREKHGRANAEVSARPDEVISRDELLNSCWGLTYYWTTRTLDQHILVLRKKLGPEGHRLVSVRSLGYKFAASL